MDTDKPQKHVIIRNEKGHFAKGCSGNPAGLPLGTVSLVGTLKKHLLEHPEDVKAIIESLVKMGKTRELGAIKELLDRIDGKVAERHKIEGELPVRLVFVPAGQESNGVETHQDGD